MNILCIGAHSDDIEIGAGGTILALLAQPRPVRVHWIVFSASPQRAQEARASAAEFLTGADAALIEVEDMRDGFFPAEFLRVKERFEVLKQASRPDLILTHTRDDHHQDHRCLAELTWNTFRKHLILGYEIPKYDPDLGNPNLFMPLSSEVAERKVAALMRHFKTQHARGWFTPETFHALMRLRGLQAAAQSGMAEAFHGPKLWLC
ncbi:PIG-L deacetylase family protein [Humitalea rosea]|uniref:PIG-L deacetylase family protein n=1 Tax=Humitalea rosea TaxID=990373 RepID=UPI001FE2B57F|nr:PIG-L deacetylase family protein [Humitalea rosea]